jgi:cell division protein YceG involved in septum cleavage
MKILKIIIPIILLFLVGMSFWFYDEIKKLKQQISPKSNYLTASLAPGTNLEKRVKELEECFE